jgi:hypothetical protein
MQLFDFNRRGRIWVFCWSFRTPPKFSFWFNFTFCKRNKFSTFKVARKTGLKFMPFQFSPANGSW